MNGFSASLHNTTDTSVIISEDGKLAVTAYDSVHGSVLVYLSPAVAYRLAAQIQAALAQAEAA